MIRLALLFAFLGPLGACVAPPGPPPPEVPLDEALARVGRRLDGNPGAGPRRIVLIKDRHSTRPGFHRVRKQLREVQRDNRLVIEYLMARGFDLLGCEQPLGPLEENEENAKHYRVLRSRLRLGDQLDEWGAFQPVRYQLQYGDRLAIHGVEDPDLYREDLDDFKVWRKATSHARRKDISEEEKRESLTLAAEALRKLRVNIARRGEAAAKNLLALMQETGRTKAILLVGGAHVPAATRVMHEANVAFEVFESNSYATR